MDAFRNLNVSASGMSANRAWMDVISENIANAKTTKTAAGGPYQAKEVRFAEIVEALSQKQPGENVGAGVRVDQVVDNNAPFITLYYPGHPDANPEGYVQMPNVNTMQEMAKMTMATRAYEANVAAFGSSKHMYLKALEIGR